MEIYGLPYQRILLIIVLIAIFNSVLLIFYYKSLRSNYRESLKNEHESISGIQQDKWSRFKSIDHNSMAIEALLVSGSAGFLVPFFEALVTALYDGNYYLVVFGIVFSVFWAGYFLMIKKAVKPIMMKSIRNSY